MKKFWGEFKKFITRGNVVDMAVGVAVASAFTAIVTAFTKGFIAPLIALLTNSSDLSELKWVLREAVNKYDDAGEIIEVEVAEVALLWGQFVQSIINFLIIAITFFVILKITMSLSARSRKMHEKMFDLVKSDEEKAAEAKKAEEEKAAKEKAEAEAAAELERIAAEEKEAKDRLVREEALLTEIRDLLRAKKD